MRAKRGLVAIAGVLVACALPFGASAHTAGGATITVDSLADTVAVDGQCTLREAIGNAEANTQQNADCAKGKGSTDRIVFSGGGTILLGSELPAVQDGLTIDGGGDIALDGGGTHRILTVNAKTVTLRGLVFIHGSAPSGENGGAIQALGKSLTLESTIFVLNQANDEGGAVFSAGGLTVKNSIFEENAAGGGGAIFSVGSVTAGGDVFAINEAEGGGAILVEGTLRMTGSVVVANEAVVVGAIAAAANANISDSVVAGNVGAFPTILVGPLLLGPITKTAPVPAAARWLPNTSAPGEPDLGNATLTRDTIAGNQASCFGGGIAAVFVDLTILESAIVGNTVGDSLCGSGLGGGVLAEANSGVIAN